MLNQVVLVGRLSKEIEIVEEDGKKYCNITLGVPKSFKNDDGEYETDYIDITLWNGIAENTSNHCHKGDVVGIKGRIQNKDGNLEIVAEKLTFLSSKKEEEQ